MYKQHLERSPTQMLLTLLSYFVHYHRQCLFPRKSSSLRRHLVHASGKAGGVGSLPSWSHFMSTVSLRNIWGINSRGESPREWRQAGTCHCSLPRGFKAWDPADWSKRRGSTKWRTAFGSKAKTCTHVHTHTTRTHTHHTHAHIHTPHAQTHIPHTHTHAGIHWK